MSEKPDRFTDCLQSRIEGLSGLEVFAIEGEHGSGLGEKQEWTQAV